MILGKLEEGYFYVSCIPPQKEKIRVLQLMLNREYYQNDLDSAVFWLVRCSGPQPEITDLMWELL